MFQFLVATGVCLCVVCMSVTHCDCSKTVQARIKKFLLWHATITLVCLWRTFEPMNDTFPSNEGVKERYTYLLKVFFTPGSFSVKTFAERRRHNKNFWRAFRAIIIDDTERSWTTKIRGFSKFFAISGCDTSF